MISELGYPLQLPIIQLPQNVVVQPHNSVYHWLGFSYLKPIIQLLTNVVVQTRNLVYRWSGISFLNPRCSSRRTT
jgi:hypothetical protein